MVVKKGSPSLSQVLVTGLVAPMHTATVAKQHNTHYMSHQKYCNSKNGTTAGT